MMMKVLCHFKERADKHSSINTYSILLLLLLCRPMCIFVVELFYFVAIINI